MVKMNFYDDLVMQTQMNYSRHYPIYASGSTPYQLTDKKPLPYSEQIHRLVQEVKEADCVVVGGASGLSAAGGGDFYYEDNDSYRKYFRPFAEKYHFKGAFAGMMHPWKTREEYWGYLATFLHTTQTAPVRHSYLDLDALLKGKDFFILTTNQDTQFVKLYPEEKVAEIQGDHRFFQCAACCTDDTWDAVKPVADMVAAMGDGTKIPTDLIPRCPHCGGEAFPWVRGYGNFLQGKKYEEQYEKISRYVLEHKDSKILFLELGVGRMTPMFIQEPFWNMTLSFPHARYIAVNNKYDFLPKQLEDKEIVGYCSKDLYRLAFQFDLAFGILLVALGIILIIRTDAMVNLICIVMGICVLADALLKIQISIDSKAFGIQKWWLILAVAILTGAAGFLLLLRPSESAQVVMILLGVTLITEGVLNLITILTAVKIIRHQLPEVIDAEYCQIDPNRKDM